MSGDTFYAVIEFSTPQRAEALLELRQLVEDGLEAHRGPAAAGLAQGDAADVAAKRRSRRTSRAARCFDAADDRRSEKLFF